MISRYRASILELANLLRRLERSPSNLGLLVQYQSILLRRILSTERRIQTCKKAISELEFARKTGRFARDESIRLRQRIERCFDQKRFQQHILYIWREFGDAVPFLYLDKYAIKHTLYDTDSMTEKQRAGFISDKKGFRYEWKLVKKLCSQGIPATLCDITNSVRYGDVCILCGPDPIPIEVKSSLHRSGRVSRQEAALGKLRDFLDRDVADGFRGLPKIHRRELTLPDVTYIAHLNRCIARAFKTGSAVTIPEKGLVYLSCVNSAGLQCQRLYRPDGASFVEMINSYKSNELWHPYYPYTLSIRNPIHLYSFISGELVIAVGLEVSALIKAFSDLGVTADWTENAEWLVSVTVNSPSLSEVRISKHYLTRVFLEFISVRQIARQTVASFSRLDSVEWHESGISS